MGVLKLAWLSRGVLSWGRGWDFVPVLVSHLSAGLFQEGAMTWGHVTSVKAVASANSTPRSWWNQVFPFERGPTVPFFPTSLPFSPRSCFLGLYLTLQH